MSADIQNRAGRDVDAMTHRQLVKLCIARDLTKLEILMARILLSTTGEDAARQFVDDVTPVDEDLTSNRKCGIL